MDTNDYIKQILPDENQDSGPWSQDESIHNSNEKDIYILNFHI